jgi:hypothetical protein
MTQELLGLKPFVFPAPKPPDMEGVLKPPRYDSAKDVQGSTDGRWRAWRVASVPHLAGALSIKAPASLWQRHCDGAVVSPFKL